MRSFIYCLFALVLSTSAYGQSLQNQQKIVDYLGQERFDELLTSNPSYLTFLDVKCSNGFEIVELAPEKTTHMSVMDTLNVINPDEKFIKGGNVISADEFVQLYENGSINFLIYHIQGDRYQMRYYVLGNTGKVLMVYPTDYISQLVNKK